MEAHVQADSDDQHAGQVRCTTSHGAKPRPAIGCLLSANSGCCTDGYQRERQTNAEAQDEHATQGDFFNLKAEQQNGDGCWARNEPTGQAEHDDLARGYLAVGEALADIVGMCTFMRILITINRQLQAFQLGMPVIMFLVLQVVIMGVARMPKTQASAELMRFRDIDCRLEEAFALDERERLGAAVWTGSHQANI